MLFWVGRRKNKDLYRLEILFLLKSIRQCGLPVVNVFEPFNSSLTLSKSARAFVPGIHLHSRLIFALAKSKTNHTVIIIPADKHSSLNRRLSATETKICKTTKTPACRSRTRRKRGTGLRRSTRSCGRETAWPWDTSFGSRACGRDRQPRTPKASLSGKSLCPAVAERSTDLRGIWKGCLFFFKDGLRLLVVRPKPSSKATSMF